MKKVFFMFSMTALILLSFAFTPADHISTEAEINTKTEIVVNIAEFFGSGKFGGCYISPTNTSVTYQLIPQNGGAIITGTIDCDSDFITLTPFVEYDIFITTNQSVYLFLQWDICVPGSVPGQSLAPGTTNVGSIFVTC